MHQSEFRHKSAMSPSRRLLQQKKVDMPVVIPQSVWKQPESGATAQLLQMQQEMGNQHLVRQLQQKPSLANELMPASTLLQRAEEDEIAGMDALDPSVLEELEEDEPMQQVAQRMEIGASTASDIAAVPTNQTGMPDNLKYGVEQLSGMDMSDVRVHYNSSAPSQVNALAYAQGTDIHVAPGQEQHLPHEAWHVVQQKQGRVQPTMQLENGVAVNDNEGLENEATVLGNRAQSFSTLQMHRDFHVLEMQTSGGIATIQRITNDEENELDKFFEIANLGNNPLDWISEVVEIYSDFEEVHAALEDDADIEDWKSYKDKIDKVEVEVTGSYSEMVAYLKKEKYFELNMLAMDINKKINYAKNIFRQFKQAFRQTDGGFSAKGRAHNIEGVTISPISLLDLASGKISEDKSYTENIMIDGQIVPSVYKSNSVSRKVIESSGAKIFGRTDIGTPGIKNIELLKQFEDKVKLRLTDQKEENYFVTVPPARPREQTQAAAMAATNAAGYALLSGITDWNSHKWEWLHIRAASLDGYTNASNLVLGNRDVNTHMMPFEANIKVLAAIVRDHRDIMEHLNVNFYVESIDSDAQHKVNSIVIEWKVVYKSHVSLIKYPKVEGKAVFKPLSGSSSISKIEVAHLENALKLSRERLKGGQKS